ncbi:MAG: PEP-CTERM sorting domain-containing protein [Opitutales bacterium]|nr:PEP-CTERM sorting domain-containing protein [Opitutales bacterium]
MKKQIAAFTAFALSTGGLFAQVNFADDISGDSSNIFSVFVDGLTKSAGSLEVPQNDIGSDPNAAYTQFTFGYDGSLAGGSFLDAANVQINTGFIGDNTNTGKATNLTFQAVTNFPAFVSAIESFNFGFFGFEAAAFNTTGLADYDPDTMTFGNLTVSFEWTDTSPEGDPGGAYDDKPPISHAYTVGANPNAFGVYAEVDHPQAPADQPLFQGDPRYWRIFELTDGDFGGQNVYILALDDLYPRLKDWDDGFFVLAGQISPVPEPSLIGLAGVGALLGFIAYRRRKNAAK